jgi:hypothetical protein
MLTADGGGKVPVLAGSLLGRVARSLLSWVRFAARTPGVSIRPVEVNAGHGALLLDGQHRVIGVWALDIAGEEIRGVRSVVNPDKLAHLGPTAAFSALLRSRPAKGSSLADPGNVKQTERNEYRRCGHSRPAQCEEVSWQHNTRLTKPKFDSESTSWLRRFAAQTSRV